MSLTMREVWGKGLCVGKVPPEKSPLCTQSAELTELDKTKWIVPEAGGWWVCSHAGLTPCLHVSVFNQTREFCILVVVMPKILYYPEKVMYSYRTGEISNQLAGNRIKREPIMAITLATISALGLPGRELG